MPRADSQTIRPIQWVYYPIGGELIRVTTIDLIHILARKGKERLK